jgi:cellulose synthase/poly-beta-1,6-N-acetylglucosamine synthase-like glycosyltransferase
MASVRIVLIYLIFFSAIFLAATVQFNSSWKTTATIVFQLLFVFRYYRLIVSILAWFAHRSNSSPTFRTLTPRDVTVIVPTVAPYGSEFAECLKSICKNYPREIHVVVSTHELYDPANSVCMKLSDEHGVLIRVIVANVANKRKQVSCSFQQIQTRLIASADDHVFWPSGFLESCICPFEDPKVCLVGCTKHVRRTPKANFVDDLYNFFGCLYLERHNFEILSSSAIDGGVFVVSGRTAIYRSSMVQDPNFISAFVNERFFFNCFGPLNADDDNFITRWAVRNGKDIAIQSGPQATISTTLGDRRKFLYQCLR